MNQGFLRPINEEEFKLWQARSHVDYIDDLIKSFGYSRAQADQEASEAKDSALPQGLHTPNQYVRIYEFEHQAVGYLWYRLEEYSAFLLDLMILPIHQGQGIGKNMMQALIHELKMAGARDLELRVAPHNQRAINLYKQFDFRITGLDMYLNLKK